jgi:hypothetical protein
MNIDEIKKARAKAEERIRAEMQASQERVDKELEALERATGMEVSRPKVSYTEIRLFDGTQRRLPTEVTIELRIT